MTEGEPQPEATDRWVYGHVRMVVEVPYGIDWHEALAWELRGLAQDMSRARATILELRELAELDEGPEPEEHTNDG